MTRRPPSPSSARSSATCCSSCGRSAAISSAQPSRMHMADLTTRLDTFLEFSDLLAVSNHDGIFTDQIEPTNMPVEVDTHARPIKACCYLFDMG